MGNLDFDASTVKPRNQRDTTEITLEEAIQAACRSIGVIYKPTLADGKFHQLDVEEKPPKNGAGRILIFPDGEGGQVWNHAAGGGNGETRLFFAQSGKILSPAEEAERKRKAEAARAEAERKLAEGRKKAAEKAIKVIDAATSPADNPYLKRKQGQPTITLRQMTLVELKQLIGYHPEVKGKPFADGKVLIVPVKIGDAISTIEMIDCNGLKACLYGGKKQGGYWSTSDLPEGDGTGLTFAIGEGAVTVISVHMATGFIGIAALSCGNLKSVAEHFRLKYPKTEIIILADIGNGEEFAIESARATDSRLFRPTLPAGNTGTDANDVHCELGIDELKRQIEAATIVTPCLITESHSAANIESHALKKTPPATVPYIKTMQDLLNTTFAPIRWVIPGLLPEGLAILSGPPKIGKSWLVMNLCIATATGGFALAKFKVDPGGVLLLSLEDNERRLKGRSQKCMNGEKHDLSNFHAQTKWRRLDQGGLEDLDNWLTAHPGCKLAVIDTIAKIKPQPKHKGGNAYENDYEAYGGLQRLALHHRCCILVIHHNRKSDSKNDDDPLEQISGSTGITGSMDTIMMLRRPRGSTGAVLTATGRDISEAEYGMTFNGELGQWIITGKAEEVTLGENSQIIIDLLKEHKGQSFKAQELFSKLDGKIPLASLKTQIYRLRDKGIVTSNGGKTLIPILLIALILLIPLLVLPVLPMLPKR